MKRHTGDHVARRIAARSEPSPITALRDMLATGFAADIVAVTPEVCEVLRLEMQAEGSPARRLALRNALVVLARHSGQLPLSIIDGIRSRFDARLAGTVESTGANLQAEIALDNCSARLTEQSSPEILQLSARVCELLGVESIADAANPVLPRVLARALLESTASLSLDAEASVMVFKAYGPALLHIASDLYRHANSLLEELHVLAGDKARPGRPPYLKAANAPSRAALVKGEPGLGSLLERLMSGEPAARAAAKATS